MYISTYIYVSTQGKHVYMCACMEMEGKIKMGGVGLQVSQTEEL